MYLYLRATKRTSISFPGQAWGLGWRRFPRVRWVLASEEEKRGGRLAPERKLWSSGVTQGAAGHWWKSGFQAEKPGEDSSVQKK